MRHRAIDLSTTKAPSHGVNLFFFPLFLSASVVNHVVGNIRVFKRDQNSRGGYTPIDSRAKLLASLAGELFSSVIVQLWSPLPGVPF